MFASIRDDVFVIGFMVCQHDLELADRKEGERFFVAMHKSNEKKY